MKRSTAAYWLLNMVAFAVGFIYSKEIFALLGAG